MYLESQPKLSVEHLFGVFQQDPAMICILKGKDHVYEYVNQAYQNFLADRTLIGKPVREVFPELVEQGFVEILDYVFVSGNTFAASEMPVKMSDTTDRFFDFSYHAIKHSDGRVYGVYVQAKDVTKKTLNKKKLRLSEENWRKITNYAPSYIWSASADGNVNFVSEKWREYAGLGSEELTDDEYFQCIHPQDRLRAKIKWQEAVKNTSFLENELRCERYDGEYRWFLMQAEPVLDRRGKLVSWLGSLNDITERKLAEAERQKSEAQEKLLFISSETQRQLLENLFNMIPAMICTLKGPDHIFEYINPAVEKFFGSRQLIGKKAKEALPEVLDHGLINHLDNIYKSGEPFTGKEIPYSFAVDEGLDPEVFYFTFSFYAMYDEEGNIDGVLVYAYEVTEHVNTRDALAHQNERLVRINNDLDNFIYTASHDLRAPVFNIEGLMNTLKVSFSEEIKRNDEFNSIMKYVSSSIDRFKNTLQELTDISKVQNDVVEEIEFSYFQEVLDEVQLLYRDLIKASEADIKFIGEQRLGFKFSRKNFRSIMINLVNNAIKYRHSYRKPEILIVTERINNYLLLSIIDNGLGIPESQLSKVFTMFKRFHEHVEGTGVGLYIVKRMIENGGGKIEVESCEGDGTTFRLYFKI